MGADPASWVAAFALCAARLLPLGLLAPWLGARLLPGVTGLLASLLLAVSLLGPAHLAAPALPQGVGLIPLLLGELLLGTALSLPLSLPFHALGWSGALLDQLADNSPAAEGRPGAQGGGSFERLYLFFAVVLFFAVGGHRLAITALADSLVALPIGSLSGDGGTLFATATTALGQAFALTVMVAMPAALSVLVSEFVVAALQRAIPALNTRLFAAPSQLLVVLAVALLGLSLLSSRLPGVFRSGVQAARGVFG